MSLRITHSPSPSLSVLQMNLLSTDLTQEYFNRILLKTLIVLSKSHIVLSFSNFCADPLGSTSKFCAASSAWNFAGRILAIGEQS